MKVPLDANDLLTPEHLGWKADLLWPYIVWRLVLLKELSLFISILPSSHFLSVYKHPQVSSSPLNNSNLPVPLFQGNHWPPKYPMLSIPLNPHPACFLPLFHGVHLSLYGSYHSADSSVPFIRGGLHMTPKYRWYLLCSFVFFPPPRSS